MFILCIQSILKLHPGFIFFSFFPITPATKDNWNRLDLFILHPASKQTSFCFKFCIGQVCLLRICASLFGCSLSPPKRFGWSTSEGRLFSQWQFCRQARCRCGDCTTPPVACSGMQWSESRYSEHLKPSPSLSAHWVRMLSRSSRRDEELPKPVTTGSVSSVSSVCSVSSILNSLHNSEEFFNINLTKPSASLGRLSRILFHIHIFVGLGD